MTQPARGLYRAVRIVNALIPYEYMITGTILVHWLFVVIQQVVSLSSLASALLLHSCADWPRLAMPAMITHQPPYNNNYNHNFHPLSIHS